MLQSVGGGGGGGWGMGGWEAEIRYNCVAYIYTTVEGTLEICTEITFKVNDVLSYCSFDTHPPETTS